MDYTRTAQRHQQLREMLTYKAGVETVNVDYSPWSDDNGNITTVTITVKSGQCTIGNESIAGNVKTFTLSTPETGTSVIELKTVAGNNTDIVHIKTLTKDYTTYTEDYGLCTS